MKKRRTESAGGTVRFRWTGSNLTGRTQFARAPFIRRARRGRKIWPADFVLKVPRHLPLRPLPPSPPRQEWNVIQWLDQWERARAQNGVPSVIGRPERPSTMIELYEWFKGRGELEYFFANICRDPAMLIS
jgi:hypothetical protein